jgi:hypothetical protein
MSFSKMSSSSSASDAASSLFSSGLGLAAPNIGVVTLAPLFNFANVKTVVLSAENYLLWRVQVLHVLKSHLLLGYINGRLPCPSQLIANPKATEAGAPKEISNPAYQA